MGQDSSAAATVAAWAEARAPPSPPLARRTPQVAGQARLHKQPAASPKATAAPPSRPSGLPGTYLLGGRRRSRWVPGAETSRAEAAVAAAGSFRGPERLRGLRGQQAWELCVFESDTERKRHPLSLEDATKR